MKYATKKILRDYTLTVLIAVGLAILIRTYLIEAYQIPRQSSAQSMKPTLLAGDTLFVVKWPWSVNKNTLPKRGDIIVFTNPANSASPTLGPDLIRRVVGLPGDTLALKRGHLYLNGRPLLVADKKTPNIPCFQERLGDSVQYSICSEGAVFPDFGPEKVPENSVFTIEDSRTLTAQRKGWGTIPLSSIKGKANWIWLSLEPQDMYSANPNQFKWLPQFRFDRMFRRI